MRSILRSLTMGTVVSLCLLALPSGDASACGGGTFTTVEESQTTHMTGHRVVVSISKTQTVLWDQVRFQGNPKDFAWVIPVKPGAVLEVGTDAWLDTLDAATSPRIHSPRLECFDGDGSSSSGGCGCGSAGDAAGGGDKGTLGPGDESDPAVVVTHSGTVGPYETVTLATSTPGVLAQWLNGHGFVTPPEVQPILDNYVALSFDFIAVRLKNDESLSAMKPLRVVTPGPIFSFPLQMLSAGTTDSVGIELFLISEGRLDVQTFPAAAIDPGKLVWDFDAHTSNYPELRSAALAANQGRTWLTTHAVQQSLLRREESAPHRLSNGTTHESIIAAYFTQGELSGETKSQCVWTPATDAAASSQVVVDPCANGEPCALVEPGEIDARIFACDTLDDLAVALVGMHPKDVWLTRLEANLPKAALTNDLVVAPSMGGEVPRDLQALQSENEPCATMPLDPSAPRKDPPRPRGLGAALAALAAVASALARRVSRRRPAIA